jgi:hypothetical protein
MRSLRRYLSIATSSLPSVPADERAAAEKEVKMLQMIINCVNLAATWAARKTLEDGVAEFGKQWRSLISWLDTTPKLELESEYMWNLFYNVNCSACIPECPLLCEDLAKSKLLKRLPTKAVPDDIDRLWWARDGSRLSRHFDIQIVAGWLCSKSTSEWSNRYRW